MANKTPAVIDRSTSLAEQMRGVISRGEAVPDEDPAIVAKRIAESLLEAADLDALFAEQKSVNAVDLTGREMHIRNAVIRNSEIENTVAYLLVDAVADDTGEVVVFNTSAPRIMAQVARAMELGAIDPAQAPPKTLKVRVVEVGAAKTGQNAPMGLVLA